MLAEMMIRLGKIVRDSEWHTRERIELLTDVNSVNCKNFYQNVVIFETNGENCAVLLTQIGSFVQKDDFIPDRERAPAFPIVYPNGGNPIKAQGVYPIPCYLLYDPHIKSFTESPQALIKDYIAPRLNSTVALAEYTSEKKESLARMLADLLHQESPRIVTSTDKQLGILVIADTRTGLYEYRDDRFNNDEWLYMGESTLYPGQYLYINGLKALSYIIEAKVQEAATLGEQVNAISTFTNKPSDMVVSIYNKAWLWMSPTWDMPKPLYWKDEQWTNGIKLDRGSYEAFLYGTQYMKKITTSIHAAILKEMFAPVMNAEAKSYMRPGSFEQVFGAPFILPILEDPHEQMFDMLLELIEDSEASGNDLHFELLAEMEVEPDLDLDMEVLSGFSKRVTIPDSSQDLYRMTILYYSGDLSRGNMHIRAVIEDVVPSVARTIASILKNLVRNDYRDIQEFLGLDPDKSNPYELNRIRTLPALISNAYGPGHLWTTLKQTLHRHPLRIGRLIESTARRLNELANKRDMWGMRRELAFYYSFVAFYTAYHERLQIQEKGVRSLGGWRELEEQYYLGQLEGEVLQSPEVLGFVSGLLLRQFENSYRARTGGKEFVEQRVMRFGSKLTPTMIWRDGVLRSIELEKQWKIKLSKNYYAILPILLQGFSYAQQNNLLVSDSHEFINGFWSGYLIYKKPKSEQ